MAAFAQALGLQRWALVGHSMGGRIAVRAARSQPVGLTRLVIVDPPVSGPGRRAYPAALPWYVDSIRQATLGMDAEAMRAFCPTWTEEQRQLRAQWLHTCHEPAIVQSFEDFGRDDIHADLPASSTRCCWSRPSAATWCAARTWPSGKAWHPRPSMCACPTPAT